MLSAIHRLQLAARIHLALRQRRGERIEVPRMLREPGYAREVIERCHDCADFPLAALADAFGDTLAAGDAQRELDRAAVATRAALACIEPGREGAVIVRGDARPPAAA
ncbi:MAG TPA: hypothetical protein VFR90_16900 [Methylibium sp.]|uniref:hypothetical protein n=1 Tax=Methylibium sp. TaxID=2067992 RepID=UPI002DBF6507|nr:hypothetical protein [Methylibium sp.]HEU4460801.1 hypothetical protein [Methylibium sp.]